MKTYLRKEARRHGSSLPHANPKTREAAGRITLTNVKDDVKPTESKMCPKANKRK